MPLIRLMIVSLFAALFAAGGDALAAPVERGFQIPLRSVDATSLDDIKNNWKANVLRIQIGNNTLMDGTTGAAYDAMMEEQFQLLDAALPLIASRGLKVIFILYSPPGGFETRNGPSHYAMFSNRSLQDAFIAKWREIMVRYSGNSTIVAYDLVNEPAARKTLTSPSVRTWNELVLDTIKEIRTVAPSARLIVKPLYGDPSKLANLPAINDPYVEYAYNGYFFLGYQHTGVGSAPFSKGRPSTSKVDEKMRDTLAPFFLKIYTRAERGDIPSALFPPRLSVGEVAVSACALAADTFLNDIFVRLEVDYGNTGQIKRDQAISRWKNRRKRGRRGPRPVFDESDFYADIKHYGYVVHAYGESEIWDPRYVCDSSGNLTKSASDTPRGTAIKDFFGLNQ